MFLPSMFSTFNTSSMDFGCLKSYMSDQLSFPHAFQSELCVFQLSDDLFDKFGNNYSVGFPECSPNENLSEDLRSSIITRGFQTIDSSSYPEKVVGNGIGPTSDQDLMINNSQFNISIELLYDLPTLADENQIHGNRQIAESKPDKKDDCQDPMISNVVKGQWTAEEDSMLIELVKKFGVKKWSHLARMLNGRVGKQCRERWHNHLKPNIKMGTWTEEEDKILIQAHSELGNRWVKIAKRLPGRTENSIKNHWNTNKRRQLSGGLRQRSKEPNESILLQNYIKSLNLPSKKSSRRRSRSRNKKPGAKQCTPLAPEVKQPNMDTTGKHGSYADPFLCGWNFCGAPELLLDSSVLYEKDDISLLFDRLGHGCEIAALEDSVPQLVMPGEDVKRDIDLLEMISMTNTKKPPTASGN